MSLYNGEKFLHIRFYEREQNYEVATRWKRCYSASSERKLLLHKLMCIVLSAVVIALCRAIRVVCLHDVSMIVIDVEGADQGEEEPSHYHVAPGMFLPHKPSQKATRSEVEESESGSP
jgi:hypothetical protein